MGSIYKRGNTYWVKYYRNGKPYRESAKSDKETEAKKLLKLREGEIVSGTFRGLTVERIKFNELAADLTTDYHVNGRKSTERIEYSIKHLETWFSGVKVVDITTDRIKSYINHRLNEGAKNGTINRELAALRRMLTLGMQQGKVVKVPFIPKLREGNPRTGFFEHDEFLALRGALPDYLKPIVSLAYFYGLRKGEILNLTWDKVNLNDGVIRLEAEDTKNNEARTIVLNDEIFSILLAQKRIRDTKYPTCKYVFFHDGERIKDFRHAWDGTCKKVEMEGKIFHDFRRTAVRNMIRAGVPERVAMKISGHKTRTIFDRYNIVNEEDLRIAARKISAYTQTQKETTLNWEDEIFRHKMGTIQNSVNEVDEVVDAQVFDS